MLTNNYINIWLDDIRPAPEGWVWAKTVQEFIYHYFSNYQNINMVSLDHDLGTPESGYDAVKIITGWHDFYLPRKIFLHTSNPVGRENMYGLLQFFVEHTDSDCEIFNGPNAEAWDESMRIFYEDDLYDYDQTPVNLGDEITFQYVNWRNESSNRRIIVGAIEYGNTEYHPAKQWLISGFDLTKSEDRSFAAKDMKNIQVVRRTY